MQMREQDLDLPDGLSASDISDIDLKNMQDDGLFYTKDYKHTLAEQEKANVQIARYQQDQIVLHGGV